MRSVLVWFPAAWLMGCQALFPFESRPSDAALFVDAAPPDDAGGSAADQRSAMDGAVGLSALQVARLFSGVSTVATHQQDITVYVRIVNPNALPVTLESLSLESPPDAAPLSGALVQVGAVDALPTILAPGDAQALRLRVDLGSPLPPELRLVVTGTARAEQGEPVPIASPAGAVLIWTTLDATVLTVDQLDDVDDIQERDPIRANAGPTLSLREALLIANAAPAVAVIRFARALFGESGAPGVVRVARPLPALKRAGLQVDGGGGLVELRAEDTAGFVEPLLEVLGADVVLAHLSVISTGDRPCLRARLTSGLRLLNCVFDACGGTQPAAPGQVVLSGSAGQAEPARLVASGNEFRNNPLGDGLRVDGAVSAAIVFNRFWRNKRHGLALSGGAGTHDVALNRFDDNGVSGANLLGTSAASLRLNSFVGNGGDSNAAALEVQDSSGVVLEGNTFARNTADIRVDAASAGVTIRSNVFDARQAKLIEIAAGGNGGVQPPALGPADGTAVGGEAPVAGGLVELFVENDAAELRHVGELLPVENGRWTGSAPWPRNRLCATVTSAEGSTSTFACTARLLPVTQLTDEDDGGGAPPSVAGLGGKGDLSLREALLLADALPGPDEIVIGQGPAVTWRIALGPLPLPVISNGPLVLRAAEGKTVVLDGSAVAPDAAHPGLLSLLEPRNVTIEGLRFENYAPASMGAAACVHAGDAIGLRLLNSTFFRCGGAGGGAIWLQGSGASGLQDFEIAGNTITQGAGLVVVDPADGRIQGNRIEQVSSDGIRLRGSIMGQAYIGQVEILENELRSCLGDGIRLVGKAASGPGQLSNLVLVGNRISSNVQAGIRVGPGVLSARIAFNTLVANAHGLVLAAVSGETRVWNNLLAYQRGFGVLRETGSLEADFQLYALNLGGAVSGFTAGPNSRFELDPKLPHWQDGDLRPSPDYPGIDRGVDTGDDRNGSRAGNFDGASPDVGAYELR